MALIIGNSDYSVIPDLKNPVNDSNAVGEALGNLDFEVTRLENSSSADFWAKLDAFVAEADDAETVLFFYSGHAFQLDGVNYLVPVDAKLQSRDAIRDETWHLDKIIEKLSDRDRQTLIFLDACRDSPLPNDVGAGGAGLARLQTGVGTFVAFATEPGAVTYDGTGDNSPFTAALLNHINTPSISISDMMIRVRNDVEEQTFRRQTPWDQSSLRSQFYFVPEFESKPSLTAADFELLANLGDDERERMLKLFEAAGIDTTGLPVLDEGEELNVEVVEDQNLIIAAKPEKKDPVELPSDEQVAALRPEDVDVVDEINLFTAPKAPEETEAPQVAAKAPEAKEPRTVVAREAVAQVPREVTSQGGVKEITTARAGTVTATTSATAGEQVAALAPEANVTARIAGQTVTGTTTGQTVTAADAGTVSATATGQTVTALAGAGTVSATATGQTVSATGSEGTVAPSSTQLALASTNSAEASVQALTAGEALASRISEDERNAIRATETIRLASLDSNALRSLSAVSRELDAILGREILPDSDENRTLLEAIDPDLVRELDPNAPQAPELSGKELASAVQTELARLGCYRLRIDGDWGKGSRTAAGRYFLNKKIVPDDLEPSVALLRQLRTESQVQCKNVVVARAAPKKVTRPKTTTTAPAQKKAAPKKTVRKISRTTTTTKRTSSGTTQKKTTRRIIGGGSGVFR